MIDKLFFLATKAAIIRKLLPLSLQHIQSENLIPSCFPNIQNWFWGETITKYLSQEKEGKLWAAISCTHPLQEKHPTTLSTPSTKTLYFLRILRSCTTKSVSPSLQGLTNFKVQNSLPLVWSHTSVTVSFLLAINSNKAEKEALRV